MAKNIIKSQNAIVAASNHTGSFSTFNINLNLINNTQNLAFSFALPHEKSKQIGSQQYAIDNTFTQPDVELTLSYLPESKLQNEINTNFLKIPDDYTKPIQALSGVLPYNRNFLFITNPTQGEDALSSITIDGSAIDLNGFEAASFGNCYLTSYGLSYSIDSLPIVTTTYIGSNAKFENLTGSDMQSPAINLISGNNSNIGQVEFSFASGIKDPAMVLVPNDTGSSISFENLQVGGQKISGSHLVQSLDMSIGLQRVSNYGFGSDFSYDRKAEMPANGSFSISSLVSGYENGNITGVLPNEETYSFDLVLATKNRNMVAFSQRFSSQWSLQDSSGPMSVVSEDNPDPRGGNNATLFRANTTDAYALLFSSNPSDVKYMFIEAGKPYTLSAFAKGKGSTIGKSFRLQIWFGVGTATGPTSVGLFTLTDEFQRFEITATPTGSGSIAVRFDMTDPSDPADEVFVFGVQFEQNNKATEYLKNDGDRDPKSIKYSISEARLESYNSSIPINGIMSFDSSFTFPVNETVGLTLSGTDY